MSGTTVVVSKLPQCDNPKGAKHHSKRDAQYDARTKAGPWANMCGDCWQQVGVGQLGVGYGQELILVEPVSKEKGQAMVEGFLAAVDKEVAEENQRREQRAKDILAKAEQKRAVRKPLTGAAKKAALAKADAEAARLVRKGEPIDYDAIADRVADSHGRGGRARKKAAASNGNGDKLSQA